MHNKNRAVSNNMFNGCKLLVGTITTDNVNICAARNRLDISSEKNSAPISGILHGAEVMFELFKNHSRCQFSLVGKDATSS